jgi:alpha-aminoadipic semialdehyde synthase
MTMAREEGSTSKRGNGIVGVLREVHNKWERRAPVTPAHCARLLNAEHGVKRILVQPCTKRIFPDAQYEEVGCEITPDLSDCGLLLGIKRPEELLPERSYAFFSHTHKLQPENMSVLDEVLEKRISLYDYELILGEHGERLVAFGQYAGLAGMIDLLRGLGERKNYCHSF